MVVKELPKIDFNVGDAEKAIDCIKDFYKNLGWDEATELLNPTKIKVNKADYDKMADGIKANAKDNDERTRLALILMNYGPSVSSSVKIGKVHLHDGYVEKG